MDEKEKAAVRAEAAEHLVGNTDRRDRRSALIRFLSAAARREHERAEADHRDDR